MDLGSVIGSVIMWVMIVGAMVLGVGISPYIDAQSGMIVIGGSLGAAMYAYKMEQFKLFLSLLGKSFKPETFNIPEIITKLVEYAQKAQRHQDNFQMLDNWGSAAGAFGMAGTLVGLVAMLVNMNDPSSIGPAMAVALITTLYGSMIGTMIATPASSILAIRSMDEQNMKRLIVEGIMSIQAGDNPRTLEAKLMAYLPPKQRTTQFE